MVKLITRALLLLTPLTLTSTLLYAGWDGLDRGGEVEYAMTLTPDINNGKKIYKTCAFCPTDSGWGMMPGIGSFTGSGRYPQLAGQHQSVLIKQLSDIRNLNRDNPVMYPFTLSKYIGGPQDIADVTSYITTLPINSSNQYGSGANLTQGEEIYKDNCSRCHGESGEGDAENFYPRLADQHYQYMLRQFIWIKDGKRRNANDKMVEQIQKFSYREMQAVIDYSSRLDGKAKIENLAESIDNHTVITEKPVESIKIENIKIESIQTDNNHSEKSEIEGEQL